jgi:two-component system, NarL family, invasion response regulator UvrY
MLRMLIADDHQLVRQKLRQLLWEGFPLAFFEEAHDTSSLVDKAQTNEWDIIISDLAMPGGGGMHALEIIKQIKPGLPVIIISSYPEDQYANYVINAGATAFVSKDRADTSLVNKIREILQEKID